jgi:hypothetical protein
VSLTCIDFIAYVCVLAASVNVRASSSSSSGLHGSDEFRVKLLEEGFVCDCLDTMNTWYFAIVTNVSHERNEIKIHYDGQSNGI